MVTSDLYDPNIEKSTKPAESRCRGAHTTGRQAGWDQTGRQGTGRQSGNRQAGSQGTGRQAGRQAGSEQAGRQGTIKNKYSGT